MKGGKKMEDNGLRQDRANPWFMRELSIHRTLNYSISQMIQLRLSRSSELTKRNNKPWKMSDCDIGLT
jgi:hypothetical protein